MGRQSVLVIAAAAAVAAVAIALFALGSPPQAPYTVLSETDRGILSAAYVEFGALNASMPAEEARAELVLRLGNRSGVESARLGADNSTVFVECSDGRVLIVDTWDWGGHSSYNASGLGVENLVEGGSPSCAVPPIDGMLSVAPGWAASAEGPAPLALAFSPIGASQDLTTATSKKVLIIAPVAFEQDVTAHLVCRDYFLDHGWDEDDVVVKENAGIASASIKPEDYFNWGEYGIVLYFGHGYVDYFTNDSRMWLQCTTISNSTFQQNKLYQEWLDQKILAIEQTWGGSEEYYVVGIRADFLAQHMGALPNTFVHLATCHSFGFKDIFFSNGAGVFLGWFRSVRASIADSNQVQMAWLMLNGSSALSAYLDGSVVQEYREPTWKPKYNQVQFRLYPLPDASSVASSFHFPAWIGTLSIDGIPEGASHVRVEVYNAASELVMRKNYTVSSGSLVIEDLGGAIFPATGRPTIKAYALDASRNIIKTEVSTVDPLDAGANAISMGFGGHRWFVSTSTHTDPHMADTVIGMSPGSSLEVYVNGALAENLTNGMHQTMNSRVEVDADAGDTLRVVFRCNWTLPYEHYDQYLYQLWLSRADDVINHKVKLAEYTHFGWSDGEVRLDGFDLTFTFPDFG